MNIAVLAGLFVLTACLYASVGFGGGSSYTALLSVSGTPYTLVPLLALGCNILVVAGNTLRYTQQRLVPWPKIWPLIIFSVPAAWLGGRLVISEIVFIGLLWPALVFAGLRLLIESAPKEHASKHFRFDGVINALLGGAIGFYSGLVGIGGGILLAPLLHMARWDEGRKIAASCSLFILVNSLSGLVGQAAKLGTKGQISDAMAYWPLIPAVLIGGFVGNHLGVFSLSERALKRITGALILAVALRLSLKWISLMS